MSAFTRSRSKWWRVSLARWVTPSVDESNRKTLPPLPLNVIVRDSPVADAAEAADAAAPSPVAPGRSTDPVTVIDPSGALDAPSVGEATVRVDAFGAGAGV